MIRILHTADWHLGQTFFGYDRTGEHEVFLNWLAEEIRQKEIDALIIAGDVFDVSNPSAASQSMYYQFIYRVTVENPNLQKNRKEEVELLCMAVPFLRQGDYPVVQTEGNLYAEGVRELYSQLLQRLWKQRTANQSILAIGHLQATGSEIAEKVYRRKLFPNR